MYTDAHTYIYKHINNIYMNTYIYIYIYIKNIHAGFAPQNAAKISNLAGDY